MLCIFVKIIFKGCIVVFLNIIQKIHENIHTRLKKFVGLTLSLINNKAHRLMCFYFIKNVIKCDVV